MNEKVVVFLGPCRKLDRKSGQLHPPFSKASPSGRFLHAVVDEAVLPGVRVEYDNVLDTGFFSSDGRECNPSSKHLVDSLLTHRIWCDADIVVALSSDVRNAFEAAKKRVAASNSQKQPHLHFLPHPSFVMRRPQSERAAYRTAVSNILLSAAPSQP